MEGSFGSLANLTRSLGVKNSVPFTTCYILVVIENFLHAICCFQVFFVSPFSASFCFFTPLQLWCKETLRRTCHFLTFFCTHFRKYLFNTYLLFFFPTSYNLSFLMLTTLSFFLKLSFSLQLTSSNLFY